MDLNHSDSSLFCPSSVFSKLRWENWTTGNAELMNNLLPGSLTQM